MTELKKCNEIQETIVILEGVAVALGDIDQIAKDMKLSVMNAKVFTYRAGSAARGFRPITDFMEEMTLSLLKETEAISHELTALFEILRDTKQEQVSFLKRVDQLHAHFEDLNASLLAAGVVTTLSRIEAAYAGRHRQTLEGMAAELDTAKEKIRAHIKQARNELGGLQV